MKPGFFAFDAVQLLGESATHPTALHLLGHSFGKKLGVSDARLKNTIVDLRKSTLV